MEREPEFWGPNTWKDEAAFTSGQGGRMGDNDQSSSVRVIPDSIPQTLAEDGPLETWKLACTQGFGSGPEGDRDLAEGYRPDRGPQDLIRK